MTRAQKRLPGEVPQQLLDAIYRGRGPYKVAFQPLAAHRCHGVQPVPFDVGHDVLNLPGLIAHQPHETRHDDVARVRFVTRRLCRTAHEQEVGGVLRAVVLNWN
jgi:hypothetical protein